MINLSQYSYRIYKGTDTQIPDPLIEKTQGVGNTPGFRNLAYIVFENFPLETFGNRVPHFDFEVYRKSSVLGAEDLVQNMVMIPGSGEFVYDTIVQQKITTIDTVKIMQTNINMHNNKNIADSLFSLDQLQNTCKNLEWVAPVVSWFGNNLNASECSVVPKVEYNDTNSSTSEEWKVGKYSRTTTTVISQDEFGNPQYGGSINDASLLRYLEELKKRRLKVMLYPMFFMDLPKKPWRGHLTGNAYGITHFFNREDGYKNFILHYANLAVNKIDAFVIGSELIGLTKVSDEDGNFPAVNELIDLAEKVKSILGPHVIVTYAADWSEYHHTDGGWYNLDPLWASTAIDVVGIDAYFPLTNIKNTKISNSDIEKGWSSGEGFDWYNDSSDIQKPLSPDWAWKNIEYWWNNHHTNPTGAKTQWEPQAKKIWFTEFGFPSIDKATNQPNIFYNPECIDGGLPKHSRGSVDFSIQRRAIKSTIEHFKNSRFIDKMFLWTWDARPYPAWPHENHWRDGHLWSRGHWVNNKLGSVTIGSILLELCERAGIDSKHIDISSVDEVITGFIINQQSSVLDIISMLRYAYCFDIISGDGENIKFIKNNSSSNSSSTKINNDDMIKQNDYSYITVRQITKFHIPNSIILKYNNQTDYKQITNYKNIETNSHQETLYVNLPITMSSNEADVLSVNMLLNTSSDKKCINILLPIFYIYLEPSDAITVNDCMWYIRALHIKGMIIEIQATI